MQNNSHGVVVVLVVLVGSAVVVVVVVLVGSAVVVVPMPVVNVLVVPMPEVVVVLVVPLDSHMTNAAYPSYGPSCPGAGPQAQPGSQVL